MNTIFLSIVKRIVSEQGESILADPYRLKGWISDYAKDEPKAERFAFGRCIEYGAYTELKNVPPGSRASVKRRLAQKIHDDQGLDTMLCADALDLLEAALWKTNEPPKDTQTPVPHSIEPLAPSMPESSVPPTGDAPVADPATTPSDKILIPSVIISIIIAFAVLICIFDAGIIPTDLPDFVGGLIVFAILFVIFFVVLGIVYSIGEKIFGQRKR